MGGIAEPEKVRARPSHSAPPRAALFLFYPFFPGISCLFLNNVDDNSGRTQIRPLISQQQKSKRRHLRPTFVIGRRLGFPSWKKVRMMVSSAFGLGVAMFAGVVSE